MALESATYLSGLVATNPTHTDPQSEADSHLRLLKATLLATFPNLTGAVTLTQASLNALANAVLTTGGQTIGSTTTFNAASVSTTFSVTGATTLTGALGATSATFSGAVGVASLTASGAVSGASAAFSGIMNAGTVQQGGNTLIPAGAVIMWSGSTLPAGWAYCDGSNGTPDLRGLFVRAAGVHPPAAGVFRGDTGGSPSFTLSTSNMPSHSHTVSDPGHTHAIVDPGHTHLLTDPGHHHYAVAGNGTPSTISVADTLTGGVNHYDGSQATTGITMATAASGVSASTAATGITTSTAGSGVAVGLLPPYYALEFIMKL